jgi:hypothetical protein
MRPAGGGPAELDRLIGLRLAQAERLVAGTQVEVEHQAVAAGHRERGTQPVGGVIGGCAVVVPQGGPESRVLAEATQRLGYGHVICPSGCSVTPSCPLAGPAATTDTLGVPCLF